MAFVVQIGGVVHFKDTSKIPQRSIFRSSASDRVSIYRIVSISQIRRLCHLITDWFVYWFYLGILVTKTKKQVDTIWTLLKNFGTLLGTLLGTLDLTSGLRRGPHIYYCQFLILEHIRNWVHTVLRKEAPRTHGRFFDRFDAARYPIFRFYL